MRNRGGGASVEGRMERVGGASVEGRVERVGRMTLISSNRKMLSLRNLQAA